MFVRLVNIMKKLFSKMNKRMFVLVAFIFKRGESSF